MQEIIQISREVDLEVDYLEEFKNTKKVPQNLFYTSEGAISFYAYRGEDIHQIRWQDEFEFFQHQGFWSAESRIAFVSLGCGNAEAEKMFLHSAHDAGIAIDYFGIDSSSAMLQMAVENMRHESFVTTFVLSDFTTKEFREELSILLKPYSTVIYAMIGGTFGNFDQEFIIGELYHLVPAKGYLYLDVVPQYETEDENAKLRDRISSLPTNLEMFFSQLLDKLCIPIESGELYGVVEEECEIGACRHTFFFKANETITFPCFGGNLTVYTGENLELLTVRAYQPLVLQDYMRENGFDLLDTYIPDVGKLSHLWQRMLFHKS